MFDDRSHRWSRETLTTLTRSARAAGRGAVVSGRWLVDTIIEMAPHLPIRDAATLSEHHGGLTGARLARSMVKASGKTSAAIGGAAGGVMTFQELSVAGALAIPFELAAETALVILVELKLVAELHNIAGRPLPGGPREWPAAALRSWLSGRGISPTGVVASPERGDLLSRGTRTRLAAQVRRRFTRNLATVGPLMTGAAIAAWLNRRATVAVGRSLVDDLGLAA